MSQDETIDGDTVRADFNEIETVIHYTRAAHFLGLWASERALITRHFPDQAAPLLEAGCGAGRGVIGLAQEGYRDLTAFDFAAEMIDQARNLAAERGFPNLRFHVADATALPPACHLLDDQWPGATGPSAAFAGVLFLFNGLMQIPGRERRRTAMRGLRDVCRPGAKFIFTSHDRDADATERALWAAEATLWARGTQDPRLVEFGDRYFAHDHGHTFMHLPDRAEVLADLTATGWIHVEDALRDDLAREKRAVRDFSDNCRFWVAQRS